MIKIEKVQSFSHFEKMKTDVQNNFSVNSFAESNQNKLDSSISGSLMEYGRLSTNNFDSNCNLHYQNDNISNKCNHNDTRIVIDANNDIHDAIDFKLNTIISDDKRSNNILQNQKDKTPTYDIRNKPDYIKKMCTTTDTSQAVGYSQKPRERSVSVFGMLNPCYKENNSKRRDRKYSQDMSRYKICPSWDNESAINVINMSDINSRKNILNDTITNALSGTDQLINLRELTNAISYNRKFDACNCQNLYDELMFPCVKPMVKNVIKNACAKESHFVLGLPKKKPNWPKNVPSKLKAEENCKQLTESSITSCDNVAKSKYILPIPQTNDQDKPHSDPKEDSSHNRKKQNKESSSDNFDKSEYLKFKQIACSRDDFKLKIYFDNMKKKKTPTLENRSASFPETEEIATENKSSRNLHQTGRKFSHPAMRFQSDFKEISKNEYLPVMKIKENLPLKPIPLYACKKGKMGKEEQGTSELENQGGIVTSYEGPTKSASTRRLEYRLRRGSAPNTGAFITMETCRSKHDDFDSSKRTQEFLSSSYRRATIGPEKISYDLRHMTRTTQLKAPFEERVLSGNIKEANNVLRTRNQMFCDGFKSLNQMDAYSTSVDSSDELCSSDSSTSDSSSSSWSLSSSDSSDSSE